ncbi:MAG: P1 family peptidase [Gammaproteobacteria bacterium]|nr:P1 family peptidase [Gammaproteobacteria bacterium]NIR83619.1 P1 family peptidase [Gammaproteobacteria bacterium]NIR91592.1 P1 family peptidase [Gammaproteobacteria bacterium]NIU04781.1 P1 family peptidase [Gammaproteobacteria bacterium]NIV53131.1 S58 family peptidase [Gammaproteobacteria bacterium]
MEDFHRVTPSGKLRARGVGIPFEGTPGMFNAVTDVEGVEIGYCTIIRGEGSTAVRTGVTALLPRGRSGVQTPVFAACFSLNGNGELTGAHWVEESGQCEGPITLTNTHSCGLARDATVRWMLGAAPDALKDWALPVAGETYDGDLNDINGFHVTDAHVFEALETARAGPLELGSVGGGTGMICYGFKGGSGSASRKVRTAGGEYTVGVFVQANFGRKHELQIAGIPVGPYLPSLEVRARPGGSIIALVVTDAPLLPHQLKRLARRVPLGMARTGSVSHNGSGDIFLACSTANAGAWGDATLGTARFLSNEALDPIFSAVVEGTEEAVVDAVVPNETMVGRDGMTVQAVPVDSLREILRSYNRLSP